MGIAVDALHNRAYVAFYGATGTGAQIGVINGSTGSMEATIDLNNGIHGLNHIWFDASRSRLYVTARNSDQLVSYDLTTATVITTTVGSHPDGVTLLGNLIYVANYDGNSVSLFHADDLSSAGTLTDVGSQPALFAVNPADESLLMTAHGSQELIFLQNGSVLKHRDSLIEPYGLAVDPASQEAYIAQRGDYAHSIAIYDVQHDEMKGAVAIGVQPYVLALNPNNGHLFVAADDRVLIYGMRQGYTPLAAVMLPAGAKEGIAMDTVHNLVYVSSSDNDVVTIISDSNR